MRFRIAKFVSHYHALIQITNFPNPSTKGVTLTQSSPIPASPSVLSPSPASQWPIVSGRSQHQIPLNRQFAHLYRHQLYYRQKQRMVMRLKREAEVEETTTTTVQKPHREERLQWPGKVSENYKLPYFT